MTLWCVSCRSQVSSPCTSQHRTRDDRRALCRRFRSTKGASKARRDHINHEIRNMRALLPISQEDQERLSYLHSMAAICTYIRKSVLFQGLPDEGRSHCSLPYEAFLQALHGFILVCTAQGRLVYVSENIADYLGFSMVDVLQGDSFYDMVERPDVDVVKSNLDMDHSSSSERSFICCLQTSKAFKSQHGGCCSMLVRGSFRCFPRPQQSAVRASATTEPLFVALCTPTANRLPHSGPLDSHSFSSSHRLDMSFTRLSDSVLYLLGYPAEEMTGQSWYGLVHPEDLSSSADSHRSLMQADDGSQVEMVLRLQRRDLSWTWMYIRANKDSGCQGISCTNFIISETEAKFLEKKISSDAFRPSSAANSCQFAQQASHTLSHNAKCFKRQRTCSSQGEERRVRARRESEQDVHYVACSSSRSDGSPVPLGDSSTLISSPYSPASSCSPVQQEEPGCDLLTDVHEGADQPLSSPESTLSYYSYPEAGFACHQSPSDSLPVAAEQPFDFGSLGARSPPSSSSPTYEFGACTSDARLVPDCLSVSDMCESPVECALHPDDLGLLEQPYGGGLVQLHHVPQRQLPVHARPLAHGQPATPAEPNQYSEREQAEISILAQQISSLASSFDMHYSLNPLQHVDQPAAADTPASACDWPRAPSLSSAPAPKHELLIDGVFDSILKDLDLDTRKSNTSVSAAGVSYGHQQGFACSGFDSLDLEQGPPAGLPTEELVVAEQLTAGSISIYPLSMQLGHHAQNTGLHQLNHHMQSSLLQDGLAEENLY
ncbi:neuronal PAS domain-containing protein 4-like [Salarias fasciatus]|uniref:neuronal PAS domain-containing protein 4-like n=1 Tax=Salarias fasciatus TaxID=181472 RepID=UPI001176CCBD|nr:neuronal PAS domain-containing protein 4-like [Salarias fasciatus]